jgi:dolichol-phosphate mannosyltransferase
MSNSMRIVVIIPTYNERENIGDFIHALKEQFAEINHEMLILVVDDNSPDGTGDSVRDLMKTFVNANLLTGEKRGLGAAYIRGMRYALEELKADAVMEIDADFSHQPEDVPRLIAAMDAGADFVIGSRYVSGGKIPANWGLWRKALSKWGNVFARYLAGLYQVRDCTAGFRAIRASLLRKIDFSNLTVQGYAFQIALLNQAILKKAVIQEIPLEFIDRKRGTTKLGLGDIIEFFLNVWWIRLQASRTFLKFAAVGISGVVVNLASFVLLTGLGLNKFLASPIAIELSIPNNFILNNYWTFRADNPSAHILSKGLKLKGVSLLALNVSYSAFVLLNILSPGTPAYIHQGIAIIPAMLVNYSLNAYWTFNEKTPGSGRG